MPKKYIQTDGVATFVHHSGPSTLPGLPPRGGKGRTLVCLHGAGGNANLFSGLFETLGAAHSLVAFDQPGHGRSGQLDSLGSIDRMATFTLAFLAKLGLENVILLGHDMGAAVALECALEAPEKISGLVLCAAGDRFLLPEASIDQARRVSEGKERRPFDPSAFSPETAPDTLKRAFMEGLKTDPRATYGDLLACRDWQAGDRLGALKAPARILHGDAEIDWVKERAAALAETLPAGDLEIVPAAGHALLLEAPEALATGIGNFLEKGAA